MKPPLNRRARTSLPTGPRSGCRLTIGCPPRCRVSIFRIDRPLLGTRDGPVEDDLIVWHGGAGDDEAVVVDEDVRVRTGQRRRHVRRHRNRHVQFGSLFSLRINTKGAGLPDGILFEGLRGPTAFQCPRGPAGPLGRFDENPVGEGTRIEDPARCRIVVDIGRNEKGGRGRVEWEGSGLTGVRKSAVRACLLTRALRTARGQATETRSPESTRSRS